MCNSGAMRPVRGEVMWQAVLDAVAIAATEASQGSLDVLDVGGGTGGDAVRLAGEGHRVSVVDPSPDALASLARRAAESGVTVTGLLGDTTDLPGLVEGATYDLVICHGVLEHVEDVDDALRAVATVLRPGGHVSVAVAGRHAGVLARALAGDFDGAQALYAARANAWDVRAQGPRRFVAEELDALLGRHGLTTVGRQGLRVFADLVPSAMVDVEPGARERLFALERLVRTSSEFSAISGGLQSVARLDLS